MASGDDGAGLYKSSDSGATWALVQTGAANEATYSFIFDPSNANSVFAPNHFGRGMLRSLDGGTTWISSQAGLPISGTSAQLLSDLAVHPTNSNLIFAATDSGLYKSVDGGASFVLNSTTLAGSVAVRALAFRSDGILFIGKADGTLGYSGDSGATWTQLLSPSGIAISVLAFSTSSLYVAYSSADIYRLDKTSFSGVLINDHTQAGSIQNGNRLTLTVKSGASAATDLVFVGTMGSSSLSSTQWGLFKSVNGGTSWNQTMNGMAGNYIMSVAIDPSNSNNVIVGSGLGRGVCRSSDGGSTWACSALGLYATASLGLAQDPGNPSHLLASNTACGGFSVNYETTNAGGSWASFADPIVNDGIFAFDIDPAGSSNILAGTCTQGILRSATGAVGSWSTVITTASQRVDRFIRDRVTINTVYAVVPTGDSSHSLYVSTNGGVAFSARASVPTLNLAVHPTKAAEAIVTNASDALVTTDSFATSHSLGLTSQATSEGGLIAVAYNSTNLTEVLVGGASGGVYKTSNYNSSGTGVTWTKLTSPITSAAIRDIVVVSRSGRPVYYLATSSGDTGVKANSTAGVFRSLDGGQTWTSLSTALFPSSMVWRFIPDLASPTTSFLGGMWSGGLFKLSDPQ